MAKANRRTLLCVSPAIVAMMMTSSARACYYHWFMGLEEPNGIWPTAPAPVDAAAAVSMLESQDSIDDAAVTSAISDSGDSGNIQAQTSYSSLQDDSLITDPSITSWMINTTGVTGYSTNYDVNYVVSAIQANVQTAAYTSTDVYIKATGIPSHTLGSYGSDPAIPTNVNLTVDIPRSPVVNNGTKTATGLGAIGVAVNGVSIYNPWDAMTYQNDGVWQQNANVFEASTFDGGPGHPAPIMGKTVAIPGGTATAGVYHYHQAPTALITQLDPGNTGQHASPVIGFAIDGFPIFGPYGYVVNNSGQVIDNTNGSPEVELMASSYELRNITTRTTLPNGTTASATGPAVSASYPLGDYIQDYTYVSGLGTLDQYNGRFAVAPGYPQGTYGYYVTETQTSPGVFAAAYPYIIGPDYYGVVQTDDTMGHTITVPSNVTYYTAAAMWTNGLGSNSWNAGSNWSPIGVLWGAAAVANFTSTGAGQVTLDGNQTVGKINLNSTTSYTISQGTSGTLTINDTGDAVVSPQINIQAGAHTISAPMALANGVTINFSAGTSLTLGGTVSGSGAMTVNGAGTLTIATTGVLPSASEVSISTGAMVALAAGPAPSTPVVQTVASISFDSTVGSKLDIANNEIVVTNTAPSAILTDIAAGNIFSSLSDSQHGVGYSADGNGTEIRYTVLGDTNLDGSVNFGDLLTLATNYGSTSAIWSMGDFNYDGTVNFTDLLSLAANYGVSLSPANDASFAPSFAADWNLAVSEVRAAAVPEPSALALLAGAAGAMLWRRRR